MLNRLINPRSFLSGVLAGLATFVGTMPRVAAADGPTIKQQACSMMYCDGGEAFCTEVRVNISDGDFVPSDNGSVTYYCYDETYS